jgi:acetyl-CoA acetyltransferase
MMLTGPTYCTHDVLARNNMKIEDIGVFEIHEGTLTFNIMNGK